MRNKIKHKCSRFIIFDINTGLWNLCDRHECKIEELTYCYICGEKLPTNFKLFNIDVREVWIQSYRVTAQTLEDALESIASGEAEAEDNKSEYSHTLPKDTWEIKELNNSESK
jgi:hypothetical protein